METESTNLPNQSATQDQASMSDAERWASVIGGSALVLFGLQQRSL